MASGVSEALKLRLQEAEDEITKLRRLLSILTPSAFSTVETDDRAAIRSLEERERSELERAKRFDTARAKLLGQWLHPHVRVAGALSLHALVDKKNFYLLVPFADCVDALLRVMALTACGGGQNNIACFSTNSTNLLSKIFEFNSNKDVNVCGDPRSIAYVQCNGLQAVAILQDKTKTINIVSVFCWSKTLNVVPIPDKGLVHSVVALQDRELMAVSNCTSHKAVFILEVATGTCLRKIDVKRQTKWWPTGLALMPDGMLGVCCYNGHIEVIDPYTGFQKTSVLVTRKKKANEGGNSDDKDPDFRHVDASPKMERDDFRPSRMMVLPRTRVFESYGDVVSELAYDVLIMDDDYAKQIERLSWPSFQPVPEHRPLNFKHLYQAECGGLVALPESRPAFRERIAVLNHGSNGHISLVGIDDKDANPVAVTEKGILKMPLGLALVPLPEEV